MLSAIIFDLDKCLAPPEEIGRTFFEPALEAIRRANAGVLSDEALEVAFADFWHLAYDDVATRHHFSPAMVQAGWDAFRSFRMPGPLYGYGDLPVLGEFHVPLILVTTGFRAFQESKVDALGIRVHFAEVSWVLPPWSRRSSLPRAAAPTAGRSSRSGRTNRSSRRAPASVSRWETTRAARRSKSGRSTPRRPAITVALP